MNKLELINRCNTLIGKSYLKEAIDLLEKSFKETNYFNEIIQQKSSLNRLEKQERLGVISFGEATLERNKIVNRLLGLMGVIKEEEKNTTVKEESQNPTPTTQQVINIVNSKNVNTGNVNTGGGAFKAGDVK